MKPIVINGTDRKSFFSPSYNYTFDKNTGYFQRWGKHKEDDPQWCKYGPEILDLEISTGDCSGHCGFCYKGNTSNPGKHMSVDMFSRIAKVMPQTLTQIAFGITDVNANKDFIDILRVTRLCGWVPNLTMAGYGLDDNLAKEMAKYVGAIAVSVYPHNVDVAYSAIRTLKKNGVKNVNIHLLAHKDGYGHIVSTITGIGQMANAVVLLAVKSKGNAASGKFSNLTNEQFDDIMKLAKDHGVAIGFDSCSAPRYEKYALANGLQDTLQYVERCESALMSSYINVDGNFFPCSFVEGVDEWEYGLHVADCQDFVKNIWMHPKTINWRDGLLKNNRHCPVYDLGD